MSGQQTAYLILQLFDRDRREGSIGLRAVGIALVSVLSVFALLFAAIVYILTSPIEFIGSLGEFQNNCAYLVAARDPTSVGGGEALTQAEIDALVAAADTDDPDRRRILRTALSLVGQVPYFWGGKSAAGWNEEWNTLKVVTAPGVSSSGSPRPYGLDCSGFTDWVWRTAGFQSVGEGAHAQFWRCTLIEEEDLQPGDLVFKNWPDDAVIDHVGIYYGKDENGKNLYIHCSSSAGGVVLNGYSGFKFWGRPPLIQKEAID